MTVQFFFLHYETFSFSLFVSKYSFLVAAPDPAGEICHAAYRLEMFDTSKQNSTGVFFFLFPPLQVDSIDHK